MTILQEVIDTLQELKRMHQLNMEVLEHLAVTCEFLVSNHVEVPNSSTLASLLAKTMTLLDEIQSSEPNVLQYQKLADGKKHLHGTDGEVPVPSKSN